MTSALASNPRRVHVVPLPESRPPVVPPDEVFATPASAFVQDSLALDFRVDDEFFDHQATRRADLPDPTPLVTALAQAFVEVMAGLRPPPQVSRWTSPEVYAALCRRAAVAARRGPASRRPAVVRRVLVQEPADGVVEACAVVIQHDRVRALALRMTGLDRRWVVTELSVG
jgi:hypothetical protein